VRKAECTAKIMRGGGNSSMIYFKNFCKCHSVPQYNNDITEKWKKIAS
jgi:hypothetical protein